MGKRRARTNAGPRGHRPAVALGEASLARGRLREAAEIFATILEVAPNQPDALIGLAEVARRKSGPQSITSAHDQSCLEVAKTAAQKAPKSLRAWLALASTAGRLGRWGQRDEAIGRIETLLDGGSAEPRFAAGAALGLGVRPQLIDGWVQRREGARRPARPPKGNGGLAVLASATRSSYATRLSQALRAEGADVQIVGPSTEPDAQLGRELRRRGFDILIDLSGRQDDGRPGLLAERCASLQVHLHGYPASVGASIQAHLAASALTEGQTFLEPSLSCEAGPLLDLSSSPAPPPRAELGLPEDGLVLAAWAPPEQIPRTRFETWMEALKAHGQAVLWMSDRNGDTKAALRSFADAAGVDPARLVFRVADDRSLRDIERADLVLDVPTHWAPAAEAAVLAAKPLVVDAGGPPAHRQGFVLTQLSGGSSAACRDEASYADEMMALLGSAPLRCEHSTAFARRRGPAFDARCTARRVLDALQPFGQAAA